ncbi:serine/threonine-protein kinase B-raf-like isoform X1 [Saccostrea echinata]|uniref:serine/threonine-protein kinase B-raf-like isoform X1 n=1 Tax=Saccostrea echinata TaxID=191078 RepID=UPI002A81010E|nr:serine/threonine-protein kinase B-raf-like isoform X1 [Saccostrea echinata]
MEIVENPVVINGDIPCMPPGQQNEDDIDIGKIQDELKNIRKVIQLTKDSLDELNKTFGNDQQPNPMYLEEYETLTNKIHDLQVKEEDLLAKMPNEELENTPPPAPSTLPSSGGVAQPNVPNPLPSPKPVHGIIKAYLPNEQFSLVKIEPGKILKEGLKKTMSRRDLLPENCNVFDSTTKMPISWDIDMANLAGKHINVCEKPKRKLEGQLAITTHNIVRKTFLLLTFCDGCGKSLFQSFRCQTCGIRFHQRCSDKIQPFCYPVSDSLHYPGMFKPLTSQVNSSPLYTSEPNLRNINTPPPQDDLREKFPFTSPNIEDSGHPRHYKDKRHASDGTCSKPTPKHRYGTQRNNTLPVLSNQSKPIPQPPPPQTGQEAKHRTGENHPREDWEINGDQIQMHKRIGSGSFGTVYRGYYHGHVAIKRLNVTAPTPQQLRAFKNEVAVLRKTRHTNILLFMGWTSKPQLAIVTQWCEGSSLYKHIHEDDIKFEMLTIMEISRQTAQGMDYLHAKSIIHRDLKSNNIFLTENLTVKIGDFGLATMKTRWSGSHQFQQPSGSILWMAPEVIRMKEANPYTNQSDVYAFGIVLYELMTQSLPYSNISNKDQILYMVGKGTLRPDLSKARKDTPKRFKILMQDCCKYDREQRPLFPQILSVLESLERSLPKVHRSASEPTLNLAQSEDFMYLCASPKTPINSGIHFLFTSTSGGGLN